jgi:hypothetical protein
MMNLVLGILFGTLGMALFAKKLSAKAYIGLGFWILTLSLFYFVKH